jgi:hypothetical protein
MVFGAAEGSLTAGKRQIDARNVDRLVATVWYDKQAGL